METILKLNFSLLHILNEFREEKENNYLFEEDVLRKNDTKKKGLKVVEENFDLKATEQTLKKRLTIIDKYFFEFEKQDFTDAVNEFADFINREKIDTVIVHSNNKRKNEFIRLFKKKSSCTMRTKRINKKLHDRFWILSYNNGSSIKGVVIGTSFNGIGKSLTLVYPISDKDMQDLTQVLQNDYHIMF